MNVVRCAIPDLLLLQPKVFSDSRGSFLEMYNERTFAQLGLEQRFVQDNLSTSKRHVVRGLHYQVRQPQGKLVQVIFGEVFDVAVDLRRRSPTFGRHVALRLRDQEHTALWIPPGFAHGFAVLSEMACVAYKTTDFYAPEFERTVLWNDPALGIAWPLKPEQAILSEKDKRGALFSEAEVFEEQLMAMPAEERR
ncbi:MAG: dTDP-4-dehydrorhamnose 3,5-epimerase [Candidatus Korobacteraceae bacterium]